VCRARSSLRPSTRSTGCSPRWARTPRSVPDARACAALGDAPAGRGGCPRTAARRGTIPSAVSSARRCRARVVRSGRPAATPPAVAGAPATRGRAVDPAALARFLPEWHGIAAVGSIESRSVGRPPSSASRPSSTSSRPCDPGVGPRARRPPGAHPGLSATAAGRVGVARRGRLGGAREPRPRRRTHRAVPPRARSAPAGDVARRHAAARGTAPPRNPRAPGPRGASFYREIYAAAAAARTADVLDALWDLVWAGEVTNDTYAPCER
jgi:hypothetical protein